MTNAPEWRPIDDRFPRLHWRLDEAAFEAFGRYGTEQEIAEGEEVFREGMPSISLFLVLDGEVGIFHQGEEVARIGKNFSFGEMGMLLDIPRAAGAQALAPTRLLELSRADIQTMQEKEPTWSTRLYRVLAECLAEYLQQASRARGSS